MLVEILLGTAVITNIVSLYIVRNLLNKTETHQITYKDMNKFLCVYVKSNLHNNTYVNIVLICRKTFMCMLGGAFYSVLCNENVNYRKHNV